MTKKGNDTSLKECILSVLRYFEKYTYPVTSEEIFLFLPQKATKQQVDLKLRALLDRKEIHNATIDTNEAKHVRVIRAQFNINADSLSKRSKSSESKFVIAKKYVDLISKTQLFELIGVSGSVSMRNAADEHDIDLFAISKPKNLFLARFVALTIAQVMGLRRKRLSNQVKDKICLNLLFDRADISIPSFKRSLYTAHEVLQMKPIYVVGDIYKDFLEANRWVIDYFPNLDIKQFSDIQTYKEFNRNRFFPLSFLETVFKRIQIWIINKHRTEEYITETQLWFCDGERKGSGST